MKQIPLSNGKYALVDDEDYPALSQYKWYFHHEGYAVRSFRKGTRIKQISMHRFLTNPPKGRQVDHINGNRLDNRRTNLRICTSKENGRNRTKRLGSSSSYKGVYRHRRWDRWDVAVGSGKTRIWLGGFNNEHHAALVYDLWAVDLYGEFAKTNFPIVAHN